jgi:serine/threonine-protein kinase PRP4
MVKLCDFGSALREDEIVTTSELVSRFYRAPEIFLGCPYDTKIDMWSLGCTLFELYTGKILFPGRNNNEMMKLIVQTKGEISTRILKKGEYSNNYFTENGNFLSLEIDQYTKKEYVKELKLTQSRDLLSLLKTGKNTTDDKSLLAFKDFLEKCLHLDPYKRMNALDGLTHEFIGIIPVLNIFTK